MQEDPSVGSGTVMAGVDAILLSVHSSNNKAVLRGAGMCMIGFPPMRPEERSNRETVSMSLVVSASASASKVQRLI